NGVRRLDAAYQQLVAVAHAQVRAHIARRPARVWRCLVVVADTHGDAREAALRRVARRQRLAEAFTRAVQVARPRWHVGIHLRLDGIARDGLGAAGEDHALAARARRRLEYVE